MNYDSSGTLVTNKVTNESISKDSLTIKVSFTEGCFFSDTLTLDGFDTDLNNYRRMVNGIDFILSPTFLEESNLTGKDICSYVIITNTDKWNRYRASYQALGGSRVDVILNEEIANLNVFSQTDIAIWTTLTGSFSNNALDYDEVGVFKDKITTYIDNIEPVTNGANEEYTKNLCTDIIGTLTLNPSSVSLNTIQSLIATHNADTSTHAEYTDKTTLTNHNHPDLLTGYETKTQKDLKYLRNDDDVLTNPIIQTRINDANGFSTTSIDKLPYPEIHTDDGTFVLDVTVNGLNVDIHIEADTTFELGNEHTLRYDRYTTGDTGLSIDVSDVTGSKYMYIKINTENEPIISLEGMVINDKTYMLIAYYKSTGQVIVPLVNRRELRLYVDVKNPPYVGDSVSANPSMLNARDVYRIFAVVKLDDIVYNWSRVPLIKSTALRPSDYYVDSNGRAVMGDYINGTYRYLALPRLYSSGSATSGAFIGSSYLSGLDVPGIGTHTDMFKATLAVKLPIMCVDDVAGGGSDVASAYYNVNGIRSLEGISLLFTA